MNVLNQGRCSLKAAADNNCCAHSWFSTCYFQMQMQQFLQQQVSVTVSTLLILTSRTTASYSVTSSVSGQNCRQTRVRSHLMSARFHPDARHLLHSTRSPLSQFCPPNPSGQSQLKEPQRFTQVPPFRHGLLLQKCLLAEHPGRARK